MAPPKAPAGVTASGVTGFGDLGRSKASAKRLLSAAAVLVVLALVFAGLGWAVLGKKERGVVDLHTNPPRASVKINGTKTKNITPMKLNLVEGAWEIEINLEGHKPHVFTVNIQGGGPPMRKDIELEPISKAGLMTLVIAVQPVASNITIDGQVFAAKRNLISIEAGGYVKIEQEIPPGQLKKSYNFYLQQDEDAKPR
jgi:hypothetical protein